MSLRGQIIPLPDHHPGTSTGQAAKLSLFWKATAMQLPSETKPALWGALGGAILVAIVGFTWGGWMTTSTASKLANQRADTAVVAILTPICVEKFRQNGDAIANLSALKKISSSWEQGNFVEKGGWATRPGAASPDYLLARVCRKADPG